MSLSACAAPGPVRESVSASLRHHAVLLEPFQVRGVEPALQGHAQPLDGRGSALAQLPEPFQHFLAVGDPVHSPSAPPAAASRARTAPVYRKEAA